MCVHGFNLIYLFGEMDRVTPEHVISSTQVGEFGQHVAAICPSEFSAWRCLTLTLERKVAGVDTESCESRDTFGWNVLITRGRD